jgi:ATP-dependent DNA helicase RecG
MDILSLVKTGENKTIEFKPSLQKEVIITIVAFANTSGGKIIIGVDDNKKFVGVDINPETIQNYINTIKQNTTPAVIPDIEKINIENKTILVIDVKEYPLKPVAHKGRYYKRVGNSNHLMTAVDISDIHLKVLNLSWDSYEQPDENLDALDEVKIDNFLKDVNNTGRFTIDETPWATLEKLKFIKQNKPTIASMLLFAKEPLRMNIRIGRFKDDITILDDRQITDTLFEAIEETMKFIKTYMMVTYEFDGSVKRIEKWDYPIKALREAVLNAIVHRDYSEPSDIQIKIYDDKMVIASPGKLYGDMTLEKLKQRNYQSSLRNKLIAEAFYLTGSTEKYGSGFIRIDNELKEYPNINYEFKEIANAMQITFYKNNNEGVNEGVNILLSLIQNNPNKRTPFFVEKLNTSNKNVERWLKQLKLQNKIEFRGSFKTGGYWSIDA